MSISKGGVGRLKIEVLKIWQWLLNTSPILVLPFPFSWRLQSSWGSCQLGLVSLQSCVGAYTYLSVLWVRWVSKPPQNLPPWTHILPAAFDAPPALIVYTATETGVQEVAAMFDKVMSVCVMLLLLTIIGLAVFSCPRDSVTSSLQKFLHAESIILGEIQHMQTV